MPDMIDAAQELDELFNSAAISCRQPAPKVEHYSNCWWCADPMPANHGKFCCAECRDDYDLSQRRRRAVQGGD